MSHEMISRHLWLTIAIDPRRPYFKESLNCYKVAAYSMRTVFLAAGALFIASPAYAYIDPGTGSALIQGLIAAIAAIGVTLKLYWHRMIGLFSKKDSAEKSAEINSRTPEEKPETG